MQGRRTRREQQRHSHVVERLADHALRAGLQALLAQDYTGALMIAAAPACIALLRQSEDAADQGLQRLRRHTVQLLNQVRSELTLHERRSSRLSLLRQPSRPSAPLSPCRRV
jgi:hypothetical protein